MTIYDPTNAASCPPAAVADCSTASPENEPVPQLPPFPTHVLPPALRDIVSAVAAARRVPETLPACCALPAVAAAIGPGLELVSGPDQERTPGNLFVLASADSGSGKSRVFRDILAPLFDYQAGLLATWSSKDGEGPRTEATEVFLIKQIEELKKDIKKVVPDEEKERIIHAIAYAKAQLDDLKRIAAPRLVVQDATIEVLGVRLAQCKETLFSACSDARKLVDNLLGRHNPSKAVDDSIYLQGYSGDAVVVDRQTRETVLLRAPCLSLLWLVQPDVVERLLSEAALQTGGFLARLLLCHTNAVPQEWSWDTRVVTDDLRNQWAGLLTALLRAYRLGGTRYPVAVPRAVWERFRDYHNPLAQRVKGELADVKSYAMRWTEQAMRLSLNCHAALWGTEAHRHDLALETAEAAITIGDWFTAQQLDVLARGRFEAHKKLEDRVLGLLDEYWQRFKQDYITPRMIQNRHVVRTAEQAEALLQRMVAGGLLTREEFRRPEGGHVEDRYRLRLPQGLPKG